MLIDLLEAGMLICWGCSWPFQVAKTYRTKNVKGKSIIFCWLIWIGYVLAITRKVISDPDFVILLYLLNMLFVTADIVLYYRYRERKAESL